MKKTKGSSPLGIRVIARAVAVMDALRQHPDGLSLGEIAKFFKNELSKTHAGKEGLVCIHPIVTVNGDTASGKWLLYMMYFYPRTAQSLFWVQGFYQMEYLRENGNWKISLMTWTERLGLPGGGPPTNLW